MGGDALVALLDEDAPALDAEVGLVQPELPAGERLAVAAARLLGYVELEAGPVKADRLTNRLDVGRFERQEDAQAAEDDLLAQGEVQEGHLERRELQSGVGRRVSRACREGVGACVSAPTVRSRSLVV